MEQILVILYAVANILLLLWYIRKYGLQFSPGLLVLSFYVVIAILAIPAYDMLRGDNFFSQYDFTNITLFPYIFLFITTLLFLSPTFKFKDYLNNNLVLPQRNVRMFIFAYTFFALITIICFYRTIASNVSIEMLAQVRRDHYAGDSLTAYNNSLEHIIILFTIHFNTIATIIFFYALGYMREYISKWWLIGLGIGIVTPTFMSAYMTASRGMIITEAFLLILCYSYFAKEYNKKLKRVFIVFGLVLATVFLVYSLIVTELRFGSGDDSKSSLISYFGQPTLVFNSQTADIDKYAYGVRFFYPLVELIGINPDLIIDPIVKSWNPCFDTFIGDLYVDFGAIGTFIISLIVPYFMISFFSKKKKLTISHLYLITFYCMSLQHGALVTGYGFCNNILFFIIIYQLCKIIFDRELKIKWLY